MARSTTAPDLAGTEVWLSGRRADVRYDDAALAALADNKVVESVELNAQRITRLPPMRPQVRKLSLSQMSVALDGIERLSGLEELSLDLFDLDLAKTIPLIAELPDLATLSLSGVKILPASIAKLHSLASLAIQFADVATSLAVLATCKTLRTLRVSGAKLPPAIGKLQQVRSLTLYGFDEVPDALFTLVGLEQLTIEHRRGFRTLSDKIGKLVNLVKLRLEGTKIAALPDSVGKLAALRELSLPWARCKVPESFYSLALDSFTGPRKIREKLALGPPAELFEDDVRLHDPKRIPASLGDPRTLSIGMSVERAWPELDKLVRLADAEIELPNVDDVIPRLVGKKYLRVLKLGGRRAAFPETLGDLTQLTTLHLVSSESLYSDEIGDLTALPRSFDKLVNLTSLVLHSNRLTTLPPSIGALQALESLVVNGPYLETLGPIGKLANLRFLSLSDTMALEAIPPDIVKCTSLQRIWIRKTRLVPADLVVFGKIASLRRLELAMAMPKLDVLLSALAGSAIEELELASFGAKSLPKSIGGLAKLQRLAIEGMSLTAIPKELAACTELRYISFPSGVRDTIKAKLPPGRWRKANHSGGNGYERTD